MSIIDFTKRVNKINACYLETKIYSMFRYDYLGNLS